MAHQIMTFNVQALVELQQAENARYARSFRFEVPEDMQSDSRSECLAGAATGEFAPITKTVEDADVLQCLGWAFYFEGPLGYIDIENQKVHANTVDDAKQVLASIQFAFVNVGDV